MEKFFKMSKKESKHGSTLENHAAGPKNRKQGCSESRKMQQKDMAVLSIPTKSWAAQHAAGSLWMPIICFQDSLIIQHSLLGAGQCTLQRDFFFFSLDDLSNMAEGVIYESLVVASTMFLIYFSGGYHPLGLVPWQQFP